MKVIFAALFLLPARLSAEPPTGLEIQARAGFLAYLGRRPGNPAAVKCAAFLAERPDLRFVIGQEGLDPRVNAQWKPQAMSLVLAERVLESRGLTSTSTLSPGQLQEFFDYIAPTLVHELSHARLDAELPYPVEGAFEHELAAYAEQAWYISEDPAWRSEELYEAGRAYLDKNMVRRATRRRFSPLQVEQAAQWVLFSRDWDAFSAMIRTLAKDHFSVMDTEAGRLDHVAELKAMRGRTQGEPRAQVERLLAFWGDRAKVTAVREYFNGRLEEARSLAGKGAPRDFSAPASPR